MEKWNGKPSNITSEKIKSISVESETGNLFNNIILCCWSHLHITRIFASLLFIFRNE